MSFKEQGDNNFKKNELIDDTKQASFREMLDVDDKKDDSEVTKTLNKGVRATDDFIDFFTMIFQIVMSILRFIINHAFLMCVIIILTSMLIVKI